MAVSFATTPHKRGGPQKKVSNKQIGDQEGWTLHEMTRERHGQLGMQANNQHIKFFWSQQETNQTVRVVFEPANAERARR